MTEHLNPEAADQNPTPLPDHVGRTRTHNRRTFLQYASLVGTAATALGALASPAAQARAIGPLTPIERRRRAFEIRVAAARAQQQLPLVPHPTNGDEVRYLNRISSYSKGLPHNALGEVDPAAYDLLIKALATGKPEDFNQIPRGVPTGRPQTNPQAALAFDLEGPDSHQLAQLPPPTLASAETAGEMVELYWHALLRDVPFTEYDNGTTNPLVLAAVADLNQLSNFRGPRENGLVTPQTLFRGNASYIDYGQDPSGRTGRYVIPPGVLTGPYISQFLWLNAPYGSEFVTRQMRTARPGLDYMTSFNEWLLVQNGGNSGRAQEFEPQRRYITNGRDLGEWMRIDSVAQAYFNSCLTLQGNFDAEDPFSSGVQAPRNPGNPYIGSPNQTGFATFGGPQFITLVQEVATRALKAVWYQKWSVHRRLRPEAFGGLVDNNLFRGTGYPINPEVFNSAALAQIRSTYGTGLLPQAYAAGAPTHPAYGGGHAVAAGACVTILKAMFDENYVLPNPVVPNPNDPTTLVPYEGPPLTVGGELNKLATNAGMGRNLAGIHWRSDNADALVLGEEVAIGLLREQKLTCNENFGGFRFTRFDGSAITV